nr:PREDICTED: uncharacterized protein LOC107078405 [Lepisosteus oculatus]
MQTAISKEKDAKITSHHLTYTDCAFQGFSAVYPKETVPTTLQDFNHNNFCADHAMLKSASGSSISDEIRALSNTSQSCTSMILGNKFNVGDQIKINHIQHLLDPGTSSCCSLNCCLGSLVQAMAQYNLQCMPSSLQRVVIKRCHPNKGQHPTRQRGRNMSYQQNQQVIEIPWRRVQRDTARFSEQTIGSGKQRPEAMERFCEPDSQRYQTAAEPEMPKNCVTVPLILQVIRERMNQASTERSSIH